MDGGKTFLTAGLVVIAGIGGAMSFRNGAGDLPQGEQADAAIVRRAESSAGLGSATIERDMGRDESPAQLSGRIDGFQFGGGPAKLQDRTTAEYDPAQSNDAAGPRLPASFYSTPEPPAIRAAPPAPGELMPLRAGVRATGVAASTASEPAAAPAASPDPTPAGFQKPRRHVVRDGDTLVSLAERYYGDANRFSDIFAANRSVLSNPDVLPIGVRLDVPVNLPAAAESQGTDAATEPAARLVPQVRFRGLDGR